MWMFYSTRDGGGINVGNKNGIQVERWKISGQSLQFSVTFSDGWMEAQHDALPEISIPTWLLLSPLYWWNTAGELGMSRINGPITMQQTFSVFDENGTLKGSASVVTYGSKNHIAVREVKGAKNMNKDISGETETRRRLIALSKGCSTEGTRI
ncbi:hypothetical protein IW261DRAFT_1421605 [Armillaria novae-zelandiae]|uniref:Uncharacterized protein n=1 Tax=Armillaria novae-zelandiae TaxID=153914 RepID=A0AA39P2D3_9AGAR|nr:hypothetical protein IW261DRAFT_1421605 [Armillaria novae-zelandiae]